MGFLLFWLFALNLLLVIWAATTKLNSSSNYRWYTHISQEMLVLPSAHMQPRRDQHSAERKMCVTTSRLNAKKNPTFIHKVHLKWLIFPFFCCHVKEFCILPNKWFSKKIRVFTVATCDNGDSPMLSNCEYLLPENKLQKLHTVHPHEEKKACLTCCKEHIDWSGITKHISISHRRCDSANTSAPRKHNPFHSAKQQLINESAT